MQRWIPVLIVVILLVTVVDLFAQERLYIDDKGYRHYTCGVNMRGAKIQIKDIGRYRYQVRSSLFSGIMELPPDRVENQWCAGMLGAVRTLCGFCKNPNSRGTVEDKAKQLGLNSAD